RRTAPICTSSDPLNVSLPMGWTAATPGTQRAATGTSMTTAHTRSTGAEMVAVWASFMMRPSREQTPQRALGPHARHLALVRRGAADVVDRIDLTTHERRRVGYPIGALAGQAALDRTRLHGVQARDVVRV